MLAGELASANDHTAAFTAYERRLRDFVTRNQNLAPGLLKGMAQRSRFQLRFQQRMLRLIPHLPGTDRILDRVLGPIRDAATAITLPEY